MSLRNGSKVRIKSGDYARCEGWCDGRYGADESAEWIVEVDAPHGPLAVVRENDLEEVEEKR